MSSDEVDFVIVDISALEVQMYRKSACVRRFVVVYARVTNHEKRQNLEHLQLDIIRDKMPDRCQK